MFGQEGMQQRIKSYNLSKRNSNDPCGWEEHHQEDREIGLHNEEEDLPQNGTFLKRQKPKTGPEQD